LCEPGFDKHVAGIGSGQQCGTEQNCDQRSSAVFASA